MAEVNMKENKNISSTFCVSVLIQGVQCPVKRRGKPCHMAHAIGEVNPRKCNREGKGEECRCRNRVYPFVCQYIHNGETKEKYAERLGYDPKHEKYNDYTHKKIKEEIKVYGNLVGELKEKISKFDLENIPDKDKAYVRRTQNSIHHLSLKIKWLRSIEQNDKYYLSPKEKAENREIVRRLFKEGKYVTVDRLFESEDDAAEYESYYVEKMKDLYEEISDFESEHGTKLGAGLDTCKAELLIMKDWIRMAIDKWDEEEHHMLTLHKQRLIAEIERNQELHESFCAVSNAHDMLEDDNFNLERMKLFPHLFTVKEIEDALQKRKNEREMIRSVMDAFGYVADTMMK